MGNSRWRWENQLLDFFLVTKGVLDLRPKLHGYASISLTKHVANWTKTKNICLSLLLSGRLQLKVYLYTSYNCFILLTPTFVRHVSSLRAPLHMANARQNLSFYRCISDSYLWYDILLYILYSQSCIILNLLKLVSLLKETYITSVHHLLKLFFLIQNIWWCIQQQPWIHLYRVNLFFVHGFCRGCQPIDLNQFLRFRA